MKHWANYSLRGGRLVQIYSLPDSDPPFVVPGTDVIETPQITAEEARNYRVVSGALVLDPPPASPGPDYDFDAVANAWVGNVDRARARVRQVIEAQRDAAIFNPVIVYDGKNLDADAVSIDRLSKKIAAISSYEATGQAMPVQMLVWRDHDNVTHVFATQAEYKQWLAGLAVALDMRGTQAFAVSWGKKSQLDAATTISEVLAVTAPN